MPGANDGSYIRRPVAYFNGHRHRLGRGFAGYPAYFSGNKPGSAEFLSAADCEPFLVRLYLCYEDRFGGGKPQAVSLPNGVKGGSPVPAQHIAITADDFSRSRGEVSAPKGAVVRGDEADVLAAALAGGGEAILHGQFTALGLRIIA